MNTLRKVSLRQSGCSIPQRMDGLIVCVLLAVVISKPGQSRTRPSAASKARWRRAPSDVGLRSITGGWTSACLYFTNKAVAKKKTKLISVNLPLEKPSKDSHGLLSTRCTRATQALSKCQRANGIEKESGGPLCNLSLGLGH